MPEDHAPDADDEHDDLFEDELEEDEEGEVEIHFEPRPEALSLHGITEDQFEQALLDALEAFDQRVASAAEGDELPDLEDLELTIDGKAHRLGDLSEITVSGEDDDEDEDDFED